MQEASERFSPEQPANNSLLEESEKKTYIIAPGIPPKQIYGEKSTSNPESGESLEKLTNAIHREVEEPVVRFPGMIKPWRRFKLLQKFEGIVEEISGNEIRAYIKDMTLTRPDEEITFSCEEIAESDRELAVPGAVFYWSIGYEDGIDGQRKRISAIRLRRIPVWREKDIIVAKEKARVMGEHLGWTQSRST